MSEENDELELEPAEGSELAQALSMARQVDAQQAPINTYQGEPVPVGPPPGQESAPLIAKMAKPLFDIFAPNWGVTGEECDALGDAWGQVLDKYCPEGIGGKYAAEISAVVVTGMVFAPRVGMPPKEKPAPLIKEEAEQHAED